MSSDCGTAEVVLSVGVGVAAVTSGVIAAALVKAGSAACGYSMLITAYLAAISLSIPLAELVWKKFLLKRCMGKIKGL